MTIKTFDSTTNQLVKSVLSDYAVYVVGLVLALFLTPFIFSHVGAAGFGLWMTIRSMLDYLSLVDGGLANSVPRFVARHRANSDIEEVNAVVVTTFVTYGFLSIVVLVVTILLSSRMDQVVQLDGLSEKVAGWALIVASLGLALRLLSNPVRGVIFGHQRLYVVNVTLLITLLVQVIVTVIALRSGWDIIGIAIADLISTMLMGTTLLFYIRRAMPQIEFKLHYFRKAKLKEILEYSLFLLLTAIFMRLIISTDNIVIGRYLGVAAVSSYALAFQLVEIARQLILRVGRALVPVYSHNEALNDSNRSSSVLLETTRLTLGLGFLLCIGIALFGEGFILAWIPASKFVGYPTLWMLCGFAAVQAVIIPSQTALLSGGEHRSVTIVRGIEGVLNLILSLVLVRTMGVQGVALATLTSATTVTLWSIPWLAIRKFNIPVKQLARSVGGQVVLALILLIAAAFLTAPWKPTGFTEITLAGLVLSIAYSFGYWLFFTSKEQRAFIRRLIQTSLANLSFR